MTTRSLTRFELGGKRLRVSTFSCMPRGEEKKGEKRTENHQPPSDIDHYILYGIVLGRTRWGWKKMTEDEEEDLLSISLSLLLAISQGSLSTRNGTWLFLSLHLALVLFSSLYSFVVSLSSKKHVGKVKRIGKILGLKTETPLRLIRGGRKEKEREEHTA